MKLQDLQYSCSAYEQKHGEIWSGLFDGPLTLPEAGLIKHCKLVTDRLDIIKELPKGGRFAEIGTFHGDFAVQVIEINQPRELHLFDLDFGNLKPDNIEKLRIYGKAKFYLGDSSSQLSQTQGERARCI